MVTKEYTGNDLLDSVKKAGVTKIIASGVDTEWIRIEVHHNKSKDPIISEVPQVYWYGDVVDAFGIQAESAGFTPTDVMEITKDISTVVFEFGGELVKKREQDVSKEVEQRRQQLIAAGIITEGVKEPHVEGAAPSSSRYTDWTKPQSVKTCLQSKPGTVYTVKGQITTKIGSLHHKVKGALYRCSNCNMINYNPLPRPAETGDVEVPRTMQDTMCKFCARQNLGKDSPEYKAARIWNLVDLDVINAVDIELSDTERFDEVDSLRVVLVGKDAEDLKVGERCIIKGKHQSVQLSKNARRSYPVCYAYSVTYEIQEAYKLTRADIRRVKRFTELAAKERPVIRTSDGTVILGEPLGERNIIPRLVWMTGHHVIRCEDAKEAVLYTEASVGDDVIGKGSDKVSRQRIHTGLVGGPGSSKTTVSMIPLLHDERNDFENAQSSSMKTLTAIVNQEGGDNSKPVLRTGRLATTKAAVLILNELAEVSMDDQTYIQDSMEEGQFTVNKRGMHAIIRADTAMIWTGNPAQGADFKSADSINLNEIAVRHQTMDRTDLIIVMRPLKDPVKRTDFNRKKLQRNNAFKDPVKLRIRYRNYDHYVKLHILYARTLNPVMSDDALEVLAQAESRIQEIKFKEEIANAGSNRALGTLERLATVIAKLKLHDKEITVEDVNDAIDFYNKATAQIHQPADKPQDPAQNAALVIEYILQNESKGMSIPFKELCERAANMDEAARYYLFQGIKNKLGDVSTNKNMRRVLGILENESPKKLQRVKMQPAEFLWVGKDQPESESEGGGQSEKTTTATPTPTSTKETGETLHADSADSADRGSVGPQENKQTKTSEHTAKNVNQKTLDPTEGRSARSARSASTIVEGDSGKKKKPLMPLSEKEDKVLFACGLAMADHNSEKIQGKESGAYIATYNAWAHMQQEFPNENWSEKQVRKMMEGLVKKGRLLTHSGDTPDRWYFIGTGRGGEQG